MKHFLRYFVVTLIFAVMAQSNAAGYMKFDGIVGESLDREHQGWVDILSFDQGFAREAQPRGNGRNRGGRTIKEFVVVKELDRSSPKLAEAVCTGKVFPKVEIHVTTSFQSNDGVAMPVTYYTYELKNVQVASYNISGSGQDGTVPVDQFSLNFEEIKVTYLPVKNPNTDASGYSVKK